MDWNKIEPKVSQLTEGIRTMMARISELSANDERYPSTTTEFDSIKRSIDNPMYDIVVCGEVKKGKSSLLNAIIGQDILPVDQEIATSQVFRISNAEKESFYLVFDDGTRQNITREQLSRFGSQADANLRGEPMFQNKVLSYIQVNVPLAFLPDSVSLIDTPGLGSVYKSHEWITQNYIKRASGVVFVFDPERPLDEAEKTFIKKALNVTNNIMFVMTKIDKYTPAAWQEQLKRTEEGLEKIFSETNVNVASIVYPISSKSLKKAGQEDDEEFKIAHIQSSLFPVIKDELMLMIVKAAALGHSSMALLESKDQIIKVKSVISDLLKVTSAEGQQLDQQIKNEKNAMKEKLQREWDEDTQNRRDIAENISRICDNVANKVTQMFRLTSPIREYYISRIDDVKNMDQVKAISEELPSALTNEIAQQWESIKNDAKDEISTVLYQHISEINSVGYLGVSTQIQQQQQTLAQKLNNVRNVVGTGLMATGLATLVFPPLGLLVGIGTAIYAFFAGEESKVNQNKQHLKGELNKLFDKLYSQLVDVQPGNSRSIVNEFIYLLKKNSEEVLAKTVASKKSEMEEQLSALEAQASMSLEEKKEEFESLKKDMGNWDSLVSKLKDLINLHTEIEELVNKKS